MVGALHHVEVVLDDHQGVAALHEALQHLHKLADVLEVQARGGLVEDVDGLPGGPLAEFGGELDALRLPAGEGGAGLPDLHVAQAHVAQQGHLAFDGGDRLEETLGVLDGQVQHVGDGLAVVLDFQRLAVVPRALADLARDVDVGQEVHLDLHDAVALAVLAAATLHVEREAPGLVAAPPRLGRAGEQVADLGEHAGVRGGVAARRTADGALVDLDDLVQVLHALDAVVPAGRGLRAVQFARQGGMQDVVDQGALAAARGAGHDRHGAQRNVDGHVLEVVFARADHLQVPAVAAAAALWNLDLQFAAQVLAGQAVPVLLHLLGRADRDDLPAVHAGTGSHVHEVVGVHHGVLVVLDDDQGVAQVAQVLQRADQAVVVLGVQPDAGFVEDVQHAGQPAADLGGQPDALRLPAAQGVRGAVQAQVVQADVHQEFQAGADRLQDGRGDRRPEVVQHVLVVAGAVRLRAAARVALQERFDGRVVERATLELLKERVGRQDAHAARLTDVQAAHAHREDLGFVAGAAAGGARLEFHELFQFFAHEVAFRVGVAAFQVRDDPLELGHEAHGFLARAAVHDLEGRAGTAQDRVVRRLGQVAPGGLHAEAHVLGQRLEFVPVVHAAARALLAPGENRALGDGELVVDDLVRAELLLAAQARAVPARAVRRVEAERAGFEFLQHAAVFGAGELLGVQFLVRAAVLARVGHQDAQQALAAAQAQFDALGDAAAVALAQRHAVDDHVHVVLLELLQLQLLGFFQLVQRAVHPHARETLAAQVGEQLAILALAAAHDRGEQDGALVGETRQQAVGDLAGALLLDLAAAHRAVRGAHAGVQQPEVVVDLGDGADRGAGVVAGCFLVDGDGRGQARDALDVGFLHQAQELAGVRGEALDVAALALGVDGVEGQGALAAAGHAGDHHELVAGEFHRDVLEVVGLRALHDQVVLQGVAPRARPSMRAAGRRKVTLRA